MKICVMVPTFNERESVEVLIPKLRDIYLEGIDLEYVFVDDGSPDGTADFIESFNFPNVMVLRRKKKEGLGKAYIYAITKLIEKEYDFLISMDADGSHRPEDLIQLLQFLSSHPNRALVIGSRWVEGGKIQNWPLHRVLISRLGTTYAKLALKLKISDLTGGFKAYSVPALKKIDLSKIQSNGYCFQIEITYAISQLKEPIAEVPITFIERESGVSKMNGAIVFEAMLQVTRWGLSVRFKPNADKLHYVK